MEAFLGLLFFSGLIGLWAFLRWACRPMVHDATVLIPRSLPSLRPSDEWADEALDRLVDSLELQDNDEHEGAFV